MPPIDDLSIYGQSDYAIRFDWGLDGALATGVGVDAVIIVDVLSFTTSVSVAVELGAVVYPYRWRDESALAFATEHDAVLAGNRGDGISLSPVSLLGLASGGRIVLPSPNGATVAAALADRGSQIIAGSLRNADAVAALVKDRGWSVTVIAAGEHWRGSSGVRPCLEDLVGAGAILAGLDPSSCSPEGEAAIAAYKAVEDRLADAIAASVGGRELAAEGYSADVAMATMLSVADCVPLLRPQGYFERCGTDE
jgi:2-phosphosulfolactate phosphatase